MLELDGVFAGYGAAFALFDVSLAIGAGEVVALAGPNGAGKSTLLKVVAGLVTPKAGRVRLDGQDVTGLPPHRVARLGVGTVPEGRRVFAELSVAENLETGRRPGALGPWSLERVLALFPSLGGLMRRQAGTLSGGEQQMLAIGRTLMGNPRLLLLDEPAEGLAPLVMAALGEAVATISAGGVAILLSEQSPGFAEQAIGRTLLLEQGRIVSAGERTGQGAP